MCWDVEKLIQNEGKILGLKCSKKGVFHACVIWSTNQEEKSEPVFLNAYGAQESIPPAYVAWRTGTITLFLLGA